MKTRKRKLTVVALLITLAFCVGLLGACAQQQGASGASATSGASASADAQPADVVVGVAWRPNAESLSYKSTCRALEAAGIQYVLLPQVRSADLSYGDDGKLLEGVEDNGSLAPEAAKLVRCNTWQESDAAEVLKGVNAVVFPGGEDVSPSLYYDPQEWHGIEAEKDYSAERDA
jgi:putative glutamine amidotransferase